MKKSVLSLFFANTNFATQPKEKQSKIIDEFKIYQSLVPYEDWMTKIVKEDEDITEEQSEAISKIQAINFLQNYKF